MTPFSQDQADCRCEWGPVAVTALAPADVTIVVDVFSFTACVDVATSCGAVILPYPWNDPSAMEFAAAQQAELAGRRGKARYSLAPEVVPPGTGRTALRAPVAQRGPGHVAGGEGVAGRVRRVPPERARRGYSRHPRRVHLQRGARGRWPSIGCSR